MTLRFRDYTPADYDACLALYDSNAAFFVDTTRDDYARFLRLLPSYAPARGRYLVAEKDGNIVAAGGWGVISATGSVILTYGMVARPLHRQGIGRRLLRARLAALRDLPYVTEVEVETSDRTAGFFVREGFRIDEVIPNGHGPGLHLVGLSLTIESRAQDDPREPLLADLHRAGVERLAALGVHL